MLISKQPHGDVLMIGECSICHDYVQVVKVELIENGIHKVDFYCKTHFADFYMSKLEKMFDDRLKEQQK